MTDLPDQFVLQRTSAAVCYHTSHCTAVNRTTPDEATPINDRAVEWHDLEECSYCTGDAATAAVSDDD